MTGENILVLDVKKLSYLLVDGYWQVSVVNEIDSTQDYLKSKEPFHGEVIATEYQTAGRGRLDRSFEATKSKSLLFSFYIEPKRDRAEWGWIPLIAGMSIVNVLNKQKYIFSTKWPNDILVLDSTSNGKIAGVLTETHGNGIVVGIGLNVSMSYDELPVLTATSLLLNHIQELDRNFYLAEILKEFSDLLMRWEHFADLADLYTHTSATVGKTVEVHEINGQIAKGYVSGFGLSGELLLEDGRHIYSGDVIHLYT